MDNSIFLIYINKMKFIIIIIPNYLLFKILLFYYFLNYYYNINFYII